MSWSNRNLGLRLLAESSHPYPRLHSSAAPRLSNRVMYFLLGANTKRRASEVMTKNGTAKPDSLPVLATNSMGQAARTGPGLRMLGP